MREAMLQATRQAAQASGGRPVPAANLHVTLAFLGSVPEPRLPELADVAKAVAMRAAGEGGDPAAASLELAFDHLEYWRPAQLLCALPAVEPAPTAALARELKDRLTARGFTFDLKSPGSVGASMTRQFQPHVTLARKVCRLSRLMEIHPVTWSFADFVLVDSKTLPEGPVYTALQRFPLRH